jgi:hypothetical protein
MKMRIALSSLLVLFGLAVTALPAAAQLITTTVTPPLSMVISLTRRMLHPTASTAAPVPVLRRRCRSSQQTPSDKLLGRQTFQSQVVSFSE